MDDKFVQENIGEMVIRTNKETGEVISYATISQDNGIRNENRKSLVIMKIIEEISLIKQIAKIKSLNLKLSVNDRELISMAKKDGYINLGEFIPMEAEKIDNKAKELGIEIVLKEV